LTGLEHNSSITEDSLAEGEAPESLDKPWIPALAADALELAIRVLQTSHQQHLAAMPDFVPNEDLQNTIKGHLIAPKSGIALLQCIFV
jgi:hypothetical protein